MELNFGKSDPFSLGIEEELMLLSADSYELVSRFDEVAESAGADERIKAELLQSTVEIATHVHASAPAAVDEARTLRARLRDAARERNALIASGASRPTLVATSSTDWRSSGLTRSSPAASATSSKRETSS